MRNPLIADENGPSAGGQNEAQRPVVPTPSDLSPALGEVRQHDGWHQARRAVLGALGEGRLALLVGPHGADKTLMLQEIGRMLAAAGVMVRHDDPASVEESVAPGIVRLVDAADALDDATLRRLSVLSRPTVLAVLPDSVERMMRLPGLVTAVPLGPLPEEKAAAFVAAALASPGQPNGFIAPLSTRRPEASSPAARSSPRRAEPQKASDGAADPIASAKGLAPAPVPSETHADGSSSAPDDQRWRRPALVVAACLMLALLGTGTAWVVQDTASPTPAEANLRAGGDVPSRDVPPWVSRRRQGLPVVRVPEPPGRSSETAPQAAANAAARRDEGPSAQPEAASRPASPDDAPRPRAADVESTKAQRVTALAGSFRGTTFNETLGRGGGLQLMVTPAGQGDAVLVRFEAFRGLIGTGQLAGHLAPDGRLTASGTLMMGRNPFATELEGMVSSGQLVGTARYRRVVEPGERPSGSEGSFRLVRE